MTMATREFDTIPSDRYSSIKMRALHDDGIEKYVFPEMIAGADIVYESTSKKIKSESLVGLDFDITMGAR